MQIGSLILRFFLHTKYARSAFQRTTTIANGYIPAFRHIVSTLPERNKVLSCERHFIVNVLYCVKAFSRSNFCLAVCKIDSIDLMINSLCSNDRSCRYKFNITDNQNSDDPAIALMTYRNSFSAISNRHEHQASF